MENHHVQWLNPLFQWPFSIVFCMFTRPGIPSQKPPIAFGEFPAANPMFSIAPKPLLNPWLTIATTIQVQPSPKKVPRFLSHESPKLFVNHQLSMPNNHY